MKQTLLLFFFLISFLNLIFCQTQIGIDIDGEDDIDQSGWSTSISADGSIVAIGANLNDGINGSNSGHVRVYQNQSGNWIQLGNDIDGEGSGDSSGQSVSLSADGSIIAVGARFNDGGDSDSGHVRIYENQSGTWTQIGNDIDGLTTADDFGWSIDLSSDGSKIAIGIRGSESSNGFNSGVVKVFENLSGTWTQIGNDIIGESAFDESGYSVSLSADGSIVAIGAPFNDGGGQQSGHARVYQNQSGTWTQVGGDIDGANSGDNSGYSVSLSGDGSILAIGAISNNDNGNSSGQVRVFQNQSNNWVQVGNDLNGQIQNFQFGYSVSLSSDGSILAVGAINGGSSTSTGQVKVYQNQSNNWVQIGSDIDGEATGDTFGFNVSISSDGTTLAVGAPQNSGNGGNRKGHVRVFDLSQTLSTQDFLENNVSFYPNPTKDKLFISLNSNLKFEQINIYNYIGQFIKSENNLVIDMSNYSNGVYFFEVVTNRGKEIKKIIRK